MRSDDGITLRLADRLNEMVVTYYPQFAGEADEHLDLDTGGADDAGIADIANARTTFDVFLRREQSFEGKLAKRHGLVESSGRYGLFVQSDYDGHVGRIAPAYVDDGEPSIIIPFDMPTIRRLVTANIERPLGDLVRVLCYMVRVQCCTLGPLCDLVGVRSESVAGVRYTVGVLGLLAGRMRLEKRQDTDHETKPGDDRGDDDVDAHTPHHTGDGERGSAHGE